MSTAYETYIYEWEGDDTQPFGSNFTWKSGKMLLPRRTTFSCARLIADVGDRSDYWDDLQDYYDTIRQNGLLIDAFSMGGAIGEDPVGESIPINGDELLDATAPSAYSGDFNMSVKIYADGTLKFTKDVYANGIPFRIDQGYRGRSWEVEIIGNVRVRRFDMATSMRELMAEDKAQEG